MRVASWLSAAAPMLACLLACEFSSAGARRGVAARNEVDRNVSTAGGGGRQEIPGDPAADDWPAFLGPNHDSRSPAVDLWTEWRKGARPVWEVPVGRGYSSPVVQGNRLVVMHRQQDEEVIDCLDAETGESVWRVGYPTSYSCPFEYSDGPYSTPALDGRQVYALSAEGELRCLKLGDGELVWRRAIMAECQADRGPFAAGTSPLVEGELVIVNAGGQSTGAGIVGVNKRSGEVVWTATNDGCGYATPVPATIHGRRYVFVVTRDNLVCLAPEGKVHWSIPFHAKLRDLGKFNATSPVVHGEHVFASAMGVGSLCVRMLPDGSYEEEWRVHQRVLGSQYANMAVIEGHLYGFSSSDRTFRCLDIRSGELRWKMEGEFGRAAPFVAAEGRFIMLTEMGDLACVEINPQEARLASSTPEPLLKGPCYASPALSRGRLYLRDEEKLVCLDLRKSPGDRTARRSSRDAENSLGEKRRTAGN
ncbi:MAG: PQQ-binding-like beta-propeller repeat protein [Pirellulales bacterium]